MTEEQSSVGMDYKTNPINPRTGKVWSICDQELADRLERIRENLKDPAAARAFLMGIGLLNAEGRLAKRYGGE